MTMILTDQSPRFGTHVIHGLTDKFNYQRVKVYHLHVFRDSHYVFCAQPLPHTLKHTRRERERERGVIQTPPQRMDTHAHTHTYTQSYVKIPVLASILVNSWLCLKLTYTAEKETGCVSVFALCI